MGTMLFAMFMDFIVRPVVWATSPRYREHQRYVRLQNDHLSGRMHTVPDMSCWYCRAREQDRARLKFLRDGIFGEE